MEKKEQVTVLIEQQGMLPLYFYKDAAVSMEVLRTLYQSGIRVVEYTNRGEAAIENFKKLRELCDKELKGMQLGIGTIKTARMASIYVELGADFIVCPGLVEEVGLIGSKNKMLWIPGCMTPSEIIKAESLGAKLIKLFPGDLLGTGFMNAVKPVFFEIKFMPTGGVTLEKENLQKWFSSGVVAVGVGSQLLSKELLETKNYAKIGKLTEEVLSLIKELRDKTV